MADASNRRPGIGEWNVLEASIGQRGMGKSTYQCYRALQLSRKAGGAYVIGHSLGARLPSTLPKELGGDKLPVVYYPTVDKLEKGLRRHPNKWHILAPPLKENDRDQESNDTADDLLRFAKRLSYMVRKQAWYRFHPFKLFNQYREMTYKDDGKERPIPAVPIIVIVDEGIAVESAGPSRKEANRWFLEFLYSLRHMHMALLWAIQDASSRSWRVLEQSTAIHVFAVRHEWALTSIRAAGASESEIARIEQLKPHKHVTLSWEPDKEKPKSPPESKPVDSKPEPSNRDGADTKTPDPGPIIGDTQ